VFFKKERRERRRGGERINRLTFCVFKGRREGGGGRDASFPPLQGSLKQTLPL